MRTAFFSLSLSLAAACATSGGRPPFEEESASADAATGGSQQPDDDRFIPSDGGLPEAAAPLAPDQVNPNAPACDQGLAVDGDIDSFLRAINLCQRADEAGAQWGVLDAVFSRDVGRGDRSPGDMQHGILSSFGAVIGPRHGAALGALSTGWAREFNGETGQRPFQHGQGPGLGVGEVPDEFGGFDADAFDLVNLRVRLRVPSNARGFSFDFNFFTSEWPHYLPSRYNDHFIVWMTSAAHPQGVNLSFDAVGRPVSVNLGFFDRCVDGAVTGCAGESGTRIASCGAGISELGGTGFGLMGPGCGAGDVTMGGSTGWLTTRVPATGGEVVTLEFALWDEYDTNRDSLVLLDHFRWEADPVDDPETFRPPN